MRPVIPLRPGFLAGPPAGAAPPAFAFSCENQYEEDWELGRLQIPPLLLGEEVCDDGCGCPCPQAAFGMVKTEPGAAGMPAPWLASLSLAQGGFRPRPALPRAREGTLQTSWQPQERRSSGFVMVIKTPRSKYSRLSPSQHLRAGAAGALGAQRGQACRVGTPRPIAPLSPNQPADGVTVGAPPRRLGLRAPVRWGRHPAGGWGWDRGKLRPLQGWMCHVSGCVHAGSPCPHPAPPRGPPGWVMLVDLVSEQPCGAAHDGKG